MLGTKEWAFVIIQALVVAVVIASTFSILDTLSEAQMRRRERRLEKKALAQFKRDVKEYLARNENGEDH